MRLFSDPAPPPSPFLSLFAPSSQALLWSPYHHLSFRQTHDYNLFFYFYHRPNEDLRLLPFEPEESSLLINTLIALYQKRTVRAEELQGNWGLFSLLMPCRNGMACYSHYQSLKHRGLVDRKHPNLRTVKEIEGFLEFFRDLEPGFRETTNQKELLRKMNIEIEPMIKGILEVKLADGVEKIEEEPGFVLSESKEKFGDFLREKRFRSLNLEVLAASDYEEFNRKYGRTVRKLVKKEEFEFEDQLFTQSPVGKKRVIGLESSRETRKDESRETVELGRKVGGSSSRKRLKLKRDYASLVEGSKTSKPAFFFGFNDGRDIKDEGYDSEPNLEHIFLKYLGRDERKSRFYHSDSSDDEDFIVKDLEIKEKRRKRKGISEGKIRKERKIFGYQKRGIGKENEERIARKRLKREEDVKKGRKKRVFLMEEEGTKSEEGAEREGTKEKNYKGEENSKEKGSSKKVGVGIERFFVKKPKKSPNFFDFRAFFEDFKGYFDEFMGLNPLENMIDGDDLVSDEITEQISQLDLKTLAKDLKKLTDRLHTLADKPSIEVLIAKISAFIQKNPLSLLGESCSQTLHNSLQNLLFTSPFNSFSFLSLDNLNEEGVDFIAELWTLLIKILRFIRQTEVFQSLKALIQIFLQINFEALFMAMGFIEGGKLRVLKRISDILVILLKIHTFYEDKQFPFILLERFDFFLRNLKLSLQRIIGILAQKPMKMIKKNIEKHRKLMVSLAVFLENPKIKPEDRFLEYFLGLFTLYSKDLDPKTIENSAFSLFQTISFQILLVLKSKTLINKDFYQTFLEKTLFTPHFPSKSPIDFSKTVEISHFLVEKFELDTSFFFKIKEKLLNSLNSLAFPSTDSLKDFQNLEKLFDFNEDPFADSKALDKFQISTNPNLNNPTNDVKSHDFIDPSSSNFIEKLLFFIHKTPNINNNPLQDELKIANIFLLSLRNELALSKNSENQVRIIEKRVFSRTLCSVRPFDRLHGEYQRTKDFKAFKIDYFLLLSLVSVLRSDEFLANSSRFLRKFVKNSENSHGNVKILLFDLSKRIFSNFLASKKGKEILEVSMESGFFGVLEELFLRFLEILDEMREISGFLSSYSVNAAVTTENERNLNGLQEDLRVKIEEICGFFRVLVARRPEITPVFVELLCKNAAKTSVFWTFKAQNLVFTSVREKFIEFIVLILGNVGIIDEIYDSFNENSEDYEEIIRQFQRKEAFSKRIAEKIEKFASEWVFMNVLDMINTILNKSLQEKVPLPFQISHSLLTISCSLLGKCSQILLSSAQTPALVLEKLSSHFLDLNSTLFLDNSIKIVNKCDKYPYFTLSKSDKLGIVLIIMANIDFNENLPKNKLFEGFLVKFCAVYSLSLFLMPKNNAEIRKISKFMREALDAYNAKSVATANGVQKNKENSQFLSFSELKTLFSGAFSKETEQKPRKTLLKMLQSLENSGKMRIFQDFCSFIAKNLKYEPFTPRNSVEILGSVLYFLTNILKMAAKSPEQVKLLRIQSEFHEILFKRPKLLGPLELLLQTPGHFESIAKKLTKYLLFYLQSQNSGLLKRENESISVIFGVIMVQEMRDFQTQGQSFQRLFEGLKFAGVLRPFGHIVANLSRFEGQTEQEALSERLIEAFFKETGFKNQGFFSVVFLNKWAGILSETEDNAAGILRGLALAIRVYGDGILSFRFIARIYEGFEANLAASKSVDVYIRLMQDFIGKFKLFSSKFGFSAELGEIIGFLRGQLLILLVSVCAGFDKALLRKIHEDNDFFGLMGKRICVVSCAQAWGKERTFVVCRKVCELYQDLNKMENETKASEDLKLVERFFRRYVEERGEIQEVFLQNVMCLIGQISG